MTKCFWKAINGLHKHNHNFWNIVIRAGIEIYLEFLFCSSFNLLEISFNNLYDTLSSIIACIWFTIIATFTVILLVMIFAIKKQVSEEYVKNSKIKILYRNLKKNNSSMISHLSFIILRIWLIAIVLLLNKKGYLQISWFTIIVITVLIFKIAFQPFDTKLLNIQDIIGHFLILSLWIKYFTLIDKSTELTTSGRGRITGLICLGIIVILILNSYVFILIILIHACISKRRKSKRLVQPVESKPNTGKLFNIYINFWQFK